MARAAAAGVPASTTRGRRAGPRATPTSSTRTGSRPRSRRSRPGSRTSSSSGGRTSSSRGARRGSSGRSCGGRGSRSSRPSTWPTRRGSSARARCASSRRGVEIPESVGEPDEPPHVLFVGRLSPEKGIHEFLAATEGLPRVIVGAGPVERARRRSASSRARSSARTTSGRRSCASRRAARATASSRARRWRTAGRWWRRRSAGSSTSTGVLVPPGDVARLREVLEQLLADAAWRAKLGAAARAARTSARGGRGSARRGLRGGAAVKPSLLVHGLRTARPRQLRARALRPLHRRQLGAGPPPPFHPLDGPGRALAVAGVRVAAARRRRPGAPARLPRALRRGRARRRACRATRRAPRRDADGLDRAQPAAPERRLASVHDLDPGGELDRGALARCRSWRRRRCARASGASWSCSAATSRTTCSATT